MCVCVCVLWMYVACVACGGQIWNSVIRQYVCTITLSESFWEIAPLPLLRGPRGLDANILVCVYLMNLMTLHIRHICVRMFCMFCMFCVCVFVSFVLFVSCVLLTPSFSSIYISLYIFLSIYPENTRAGWGFRCIYPWRFAACVLWCVWAWLRLCVMVRVWRGEWVVCVCRGGWVSFVCVLGRVRFVSCVLFSFLLHVYTCISSICISWKVVIYVWGSYFVFVSWKVGKWQFRSWSVMFLVSFRVVVSWRVLWADREVIGVSVAMVFFYVCRCLTPTLTSALRQLWITSIWQQWTLHLTCTKKE